MDYEQIKSYQTTENIPRDVLEGARKVGEGRKAFRKMLETYIPRTNYHINGNERILNLGCGKCYEAYVLSGYFGGKHYGSDSENVFLVGIDIDAKEIERAKQEYTRLDFSERVAKFIEKTNYKFVEGDAKRLRELVNGEFDVVIARHTNVAEIPDTWRTIFQEAYHLLKTRGILLATSFSDLEHQMLEEQVQKAGYKIALSESNAYAIPTSDKEVSIDRKILLARK